VGIKGRNVKGEGDKGLKIILFNEDPKEDNIHERPL
jgi:hypothetical protein